MYPFLSVVAKENLSYVQIWLHIPAQNPIMAPHGLQDKIQPLHRSWSMYDLLITLQLLQLPWAKPKHSRSLCIVLSSISVLHMLPPPWKMLPILAHPSNSPQPPPRHPPPIFWPLFWPGGGRSPLNFQSTVFLFYLNGSHLPNPSDSHTIAGSPGTVAEMCHTLVCSIAQDRNGQFAFNRGEEHRTNAKVSVWTQRWQNRYSRTLSLEKPCSLDLNSWNTR